MGAADTERPALIFDVDGVILNWCGGFLEWMAGQGHRVTSREPSSYDMANCLPELPRDALLPHIEAFNRHPDYAELKTLPGAVESIRRLHVSDFRDWRSVVVSATGHAFWTIKYRAEALSRIHFFDELHCIGVRDSKAEFYWRYPSGSIVFEDSTHHALDALDAGLRVVFFSYPYNADCPDFRPGLIKVDSWQAAEVAAVTLASLTDAEVFGV